MDALEKSGGRPPLEWRKWINDNIGLAIGLATLVVAIIGVAIAYFAWWQPQWKQHADSDLATLIDGRIDAKFNSNGFGGLKTSVDKMNGQMQEISSYLKIIVAKDLGQSASLSPQEFQKKLPEVKASLEVARITQTQASNKAVDGIRSNLLQSNRNGAEFWGVAASFVDYQYPQDLKKLESCLIKPPSGLPNGPIDVTGPATITLDANKGYYHDCELVLDEPMSLQTRNFFGVEFKVQCRRCKIVYRGGQIPLLGGLLQSLTFVDCVFEVTAPTAPPDEGKAFLLSVLKAQDPKLVTYPGL